MPRPTPTLVSKPSFKDHIKWTALLVGAAVTAPFVIMGAIWMLTWFMEWVRISWSWPS